MRVSGIHQGPQAMACINRPDINLQPNLSVITPRSSCTSGGVHINPHDHCNPQADIAPVADRPPYAETKDRTSAPRGAWPARWASTAGACMRSGAWSDIRLPAYSRRVRPISQRSVSIPPC